MIGVGSYRPDIADTNATVARRACNVLLSRDENGVAHNPMPGLAVLASAVALPGAPKGGVSIVDSSGAYSCIVGTSATLQKLLSDYSWLEIGSGYALTDGDSWSYGRYGANLYITNRTDGMLKFDVDVGSVVDPVASAPKARFIFPCFNTLMALDCDGDNKLMRNSAIGNAEIWTGKGAGSQSFPDGEELVCGTELTSDLAIVWQRNAIRALMRRDDGKLYDAKKLYDGRGCVNAQAMAAVDGKAFFVDTDGFYMIDASGALSPIGKDKVSKSFIRRLASDGLDTISAAIDKVNTRVVFRFHDQNVPSSTVYDDAIAYDYELGEWSEIEETTAAIFTMASPAITLDSMDGFGPLDGIAIPLDSRFWAGGEPRLAALDADFKFGFFDGPSLAATSETGSKLALQSGLITSITPVTDAANAMVQVGVRDRLSDPIVWKDGVPMQPSGRAPVRARGKIMTFRLTAVAGEVWTTTRGFDGFNVSAGGPR